MRSAYGLTQRFATMCLCPARVSAVIIHVRGNGKHVVGHFQHRCCCGFHGAVNNGSEVTSRHATVFILLNVTKY